MVPFQLICGDALDELRKIPRKSIHCVVTSPPYYGLRDYKQPGQIGLERSPDEYVKRLVEVFREVWHVLRDEGTLWINIGDSYARMQEGNVPQSKNIECTPPVMSGRIKNAGLKPKDLIGIPWRLAFALQADGWYLRSDIIWAKPNAMPESVLDRPTRSHEYIFLLSKKERYFYDSTSISEPSVCTHSSGNGYKRESRLSYQDDNGPRGSDKPWVPKGKHSATDKQSRGKRMTENVALNRSLGADHDSPFGATRNKRSVWIVSTVPYAKAHFATYPPELIYPCILAGCPSGGTVLDPFVGSGTTIIAAIRNNRSAIGIDLNGEYIEMARQRIMSEVPLLSKDESTVQPSPDPDLTGMPLFEQP